MKMRFWQRTYIFTLVLFLVCLNIGVLSLTVYTYKKNVAAAEAAAGAEQHYAAMSFERDYTDMTEASPHSSPTLLMQSYGAYYEKKGLCLAFYENGRLLYTSFASEYPVQDDSLIHTDIEGKRHILISSHICSDKYVMVFGKNVESLDGEFRSLMLTYVLTSAAVSLVLALCLYFILKTLSAPLEKLRHTTRAIEAGDFSVTAEEKGNDEFTQLAKSFNSMLVKINGQMTALEDEAEKKQMLVDNMAHELRTPLTSIHGYAEYIEKANTTEEERLIAAKYIMSEADRLKKISEILLDGAFIRENEIEMAPVDLAKVLNDVCEKLKLTSDRAGVKLSCLAHPVAVRGNETLLSMLFYNLTENAIKACSLGGQVLISCKNGSVCVEDNGKGMTREQLLHITEPFYRTDRSRSRADGGAGLGLALCKRIAVTHGAKMEFESEPGKGTRIFVTFTA